MTLHTITTRQFHHGDQMRRLTALRQRVGRLFYGHGASASTAMTHIAIQEALNGKTVEWMEHVTDAQYRK